MVRDTEDGEKGSYIHLARSLFLSNQRLRMRELVGLSLVKLLFNNSHMLGLLPEAHSRTSGYHFPSRYGHIRRVKPWFGHTALSPHCHSDDENMEILEYSDTFIFNYAIIESPS